MRPPPHGTSSTEPGGIPAKARATSFISARCLRRGRCWYSAAASSVYLVRPGYAGMAEREFRGLRQWRGWCVDRGRLSLVRQLFPPWRGRVFELR